VGSNVGGVGGRRASTPGGGGGFGFQPQRPPFVPPKPARDETSAAFLADLSSVRLPPVADAKVHAFNCDVCRVELTGRYVAKFFFLFFDGENECFLLMFWIGRESGVWNAISTFVQPVIGRRIIHQLIAAPTNSKLCGPAIIRSAIGTPGPPNISAIAVTRT